MCIPDVTFLFGDDGGECEVGWERLWQTLLGLRTYTAEQWLSLAFGQGLMLLALLRYVV